MVVVSSKIMLKILLRFEVIQFLFLYKHFEQTPQPHGEKNISYLRLKMLCRYYRISKTPTQPKNQLKVS